MHASSHFHAELSDELGFGGHLDIVLIGEPLPLSFSVFILELEQMSNDLGGVLGGNNLLLAQHGHVGDGAPQILVNHAGVDGSRVGPCKKRF
jgi:hypothetical protein